MERALVSPLNQSDISSELWRNNENGFITYIQYGYNETESLNRLKALFNKLPLDPYLKSCHNFRYKMSGRLRAIIRYDGVRFKVETPKALYQSTKVNDYTGGIVRSYKRVPNSILLSDFVLSFLRITLNYLIHNMPAKHVEWVINCAFVRTKANRNTVGYITPEGFHKDEILYGGIVYISGNKYSGGVTQFKDNKGNGIGTIRLSKLGDCVLFTDHFVLHAVTPIKPRKYAKQCSRDVIQFSFFPL